MYLSGEYNLHRPRVVYGRRDLVLILQRQRATPTLIRVGRTSFNDTELRQLPLGNREFVCLTDVVAGKLKRIIDRVLNDSTRMETRSCHVGVEIDAIDG